MWSGAELKEHAATAVPVVKASVKTAAPIVLKRAAQGAAAGAIGGTAGMREGAKLGARQGLKEAAVPALMSGRNAYLQQGQSDANRGNFNQIF
jgi:hypothetical protein